MNYFQPVRSHPLPPATMCQISAVISDLLYLPEVPFLSHLPLKDRKSPILHQMRRFNIQHHTPHGKIAAMKLKSFLGCVWLPILQEAGVWQPTKKK